MFVHNVNVNVVVDILVKFKANNLITKFFSSIFKLSLALQFIIE